MQIDAITLAALADEWRLLLINARIDVIIQPTVHSIAIQCYALSQEQGQGGKNRWLYFSAHPQLARAHITTLKPSRIVKEPPAFVMLLRKYLEGTRIEVIEQARWERVIEIRAGHRDASDPEKRTSYRLLIEVMGRMSNIILCNDQGLILGSLKHVGADINRYRVIDTNVPYVPPPPQQHMVAGVPLPRLEPTVVTAAQLAECKREEIELTQIAESRSRGKSTKKQEPKMWQLLTRNLLGFSPLLAREAVYRAIGDAEFAINTGDANMEELAWNVRELAVLFDKHTWNPQLVEHVGDVGDMQSFFSQPVPIAFAPYVLAQYSEMPGLRIRESASINILIDEFYAGAEWRDAMESVRKPLRKVLQTQLERCKRKAELLQQELSVSEDASRYRLQAELLLAYQFEVKQGQSSVVLPNIFEDKSQSLDVTIPLDPRFNAVGNANRFFHKYHKLRRALALVPDQIEKNITEQAMVEQLLADLMLADTPAEVALVKAEMQSAGYIRGAKTSRSATTSPQKQSHKSKSGKQQKTKPVPPGGGVPLHIQSRDGFTILIGKNSRQNEEVTFHQASANDTWLHARGVPGAHVIVKAGGRDITRSTLEQAASLAAYYSQARGSTRIPVDYTLQRYVRHMKGGGPGLVIYEREKTLYAEPEAFLD
ncbi:MAG TPA: NFACT RNA binding domain-containing protein [Ktedonobacteraceae bacterium]|nr:NFACT RNA binding domain-containing protein [Ktedonobacteraceae bacterium]